MSKRGLRLIGILVLGLLSAVPAAAKMVVLDPMEDPKSWDVAKDNTASGAVAAVPGPNGQKALELQYELIGGTWIAYFKKLPAGTPGLKAIVFQYRGEGANNLDIKLADVSGATYGFHIPAGTEAKDWVRVVIPANQLEYLYGGQNRPPNTDNFRRFEFTVSSGEGGVGKVAVANLQYSTEVMAGTVPPAPKPSAAPAAASAAAPAAEKAPARDQKAWPAAKSIVITSDKNWQIYIDQGASARLTTVDGPAEGKKAVEVLYTWGLRDIPGVQQATGSWIAMVTEGKFDLTEVRKIIVPFKNTGAVTNLEIKLHDQDGTVWGRTIPSGNAAAVWTNLAVMRSEFKYLWGGDGSGKIDWGHVKQIEIALSRASDARDNGTFDFSDITFESAATPGTAPFAPYASAPTGVSPTAAGAPAAGAAETVEGQVRVSIDDFTDLNPTNRYYVIPADDSTLQLAPSRIAFESDYSMDMRYALSSNRPTGSWVEAQRRFTPPLDWTGVEAVKIWVRGDGSRNVFRFTLTDGEGNQWIYDNEDVLASTDWFLVTMPVTGFALFQDIYRRAPVTGNLRAHLQTIKAYSLIILSQPNRSSLNNGEIWVENLYLSGKGINVNRAVPIQEKPPIGIAVPLKNWNIGGTSNTLSETTPQNGNVLTQNIDFKLLGNFEKFSVLGEIKAEGTFGDEYDFFRSKDAKVFSPNTNVTLLNPVEGVSDLMVGNMWFNSDPAIFANDNLYGGWGFKGALVEGWVERFHHRTYYLKHTPDNYSLAGHYSYNYETLNLNVIGTYYNQSPFVVNATKLEQDDKAVLFDANKSFVLPRVLTTVLHVQYGYDWYQKYWDTSQQTAIDLRQAGQLASAEVNITDMADIFWPGLSLTVRYRYLEPAFKPQYRQHPGYWDIEMGDQKGADFKFYQTIGGAYLSAEYDKINRVSQPDQYRERTLLSIGYNNWASLDVTLSQEFNTKIYHFLNTRYLTNDAPTQIDDDKNENITTLYLAYHFSGAFVLSQWMQVNRTKIRPTSEQNTQLVANTKLTYYPATNVALSLENKLSNLGKLAETPVIDPVNPNAADNYTRIRIDLTF
jgi:hypothetical protein